MSPITEQDPGSATDVGPLVREVVVPCDSATAYRLFTADIGQWWPVDPHSVYGAAATVAFEDDELVERHGTERTVWGEVLTNDPPHGFTMTWHPGHGPESADVTEVDVRFEPHEGGTLVRLIHSGWERLGQPERRASYGSGWVLVLDRFAERVAG